VGRVVPVYSKANQCETHRMNDLPQVSGAKGSTGWPDKQFSSLLPTGSLTPADRHGSVQVKMLSAVQATARGGQARLSY